MMLRRLRYVMHHPTFERIDRAIAGAMGRCGHVVERVGLAMVFCWFGTLKLLGETTATSIIAKTVYIGSPEVTVPFLGLWEILIGLGFLYRPTIRVSILLLAIRLPGTLLALALRPEECFMSSIFIPSIQGQYLIKDAALFGAAMVIGASIQSRDRLSGHGLR